MIQEQIFTGLSGSSDTSFTSKGANVNLSKSILANAK